jgi:hypothetical protein
MVPSRTPWLAAVAAALLSLSSARAAGPDRLLPADSEFVLTVNVKQLLESPLVKKRGLEAAREALKSAGDINQILEDVGFDPFTDLDRVTVAGPSGNDKDRGLIILRGRFDAERIKARAAKAAKDDPDALKIRKVPDGVVYEITQPDQDATLFVALIDGKTLVASGGKDYVVDAMRKEAGKEQGRIKDKDFQAVLERMDGRQTVAFAAVGAAFRGAGDVPGGDFLEKVDAVGGGLTLGDELKLELVVSTRSESDARDIKEKVNAAINAGIAFLGVAADQSKEIESLLDVLKTVKATAKDKTVTLKLRVSADVLEGLTGKSAD